MKALVLFASMILIAGCHEKGGASVVPTAPTRPSVPTVASCTTAPADFVWFIDRDMSGPHVTLSTAYVLAGYEVQEGGRDWQPYASGGRITVIQFTGHFNTVYRVRGKIGDCWSNWHGFAVGPANPDASGGGPVSPAPVCRRYGPDGICDVWG